MVQVVIFIIIIKLGSDDPHTMMIIAMILEIMFFIIIFCSPAPNNRTACSQRDEIGKYSEALTEALQVRILMIIDYDDHDHDDHDDHDHEFEKLLLKQ